MRKHVIPCGLFALFCCWIAANASSTPGKEEKGRRFSLHVAGEHTVLLNEMEGTTWTLKTDSSKVPFWCPMGKLEAAEEAKKLPRSAGKSGESKGARPLSQRRPIVLNLGRPRAGYITLPVQVRGHTLHLVVDSGAPQTHFDKNKTKAFMDWQAIGNQGGKQLLVAADSIAVVKDFSVGPISVGELYVAGTDFSNLNKALAILADPPLDGVLGMDVLTKCKAVIDLSEFRIALHPPEDAR